MEALEGLLRSLVPRASQFAYYDLKGDCLWRSKDAVEADDPEVISRMRKLQGGSTGEGRPTALEVNIRGSNPHYILPVVGKDAVQHGFLVTVYGSPDSSAKPPSGAMLTNLLMPAVDVFIDALVVKRRYTREQAQLVRAENQLQVIYSLDKKLEQSPHGQASLAYLVGGAARHLRIGYSVFLMPSKRIRISVTHPDWKGVDRTQLDQSVLEQFFPAVCEQEASALIELRNLPKGLKRPLDLFQVILCPIREGKRRVTGVLALFAQTHGVPFTQNDQQFVELVARKTERVIELNYDPMTGLMNRAGFESHLREAYGQLSEEGDAHCLIVFDIDKMQLFNDTFDHRAGDEVLIRFATELQQQLPPNGVASRLSGADFGVLLPHTDVDEGVKLADELRKVAHKMSYLNGDKSHQITVSAGVASFQVNDDGYDGALIRPKVACTAAKDHGRDRVEVYDQDDHSIVRRVDDMHIVGQIHNALSNGEFLLVAQPIQPLQKGEHQAHFEVLVRMQGSGGEVLKPEMFFSAAERYQLMPRLDRWVIRATLEKLSQRREMLMASNCVFSINLSGQSLQDDSLLEYVLEQMRSAGVPAKAICFEITETAAVSNMMTAQRFIKHLKEKGCGFSLDDFGAGLSSFGYLKSLDVDTLKIDGSFVRDLNENKVSEAMVAAITQVAQVMGLKTIAEYVETEAVRDRIKEIGVDYAQGYLYGEPIALDQILDKVSGDARKAS